MALPPCLGPTPPSEPFSHPPGAPRELNASGCTICSASGEERIRSEQAQKLGQDSWDPPEPFQGGPRGTEPAAGLPRLPTTPSHEDSAGAKHREHPISGREVLEAEQDSLHLCLLGLGLRLQDLEQGLGPWASAQSRMVQLQALQADLRGAAERLDALLVFGEGLAQRSEPQARASLEQVLRAFRAHRDSIFRQLWRLQAQLVFEEASTLEQDLEVEGDSDGPGPGGVWGPWAPSSLPTPAELEWDPAGDVGDLGPLGQRTAWTPGTSCELCGRRGPQGRGQSLEVRAGGGHLPPGTQGTLCVSPSRALFPFRGGLHGSVSPGVSFAFGVSVVSSLCPLGLQVSLLYLYFLISSHSPPHSPHRSHTSLLALQIFQIHSHLKSPQRHTELTSSLHSIQSLLKCYLFREACPGLQTLSLLILLLYFLTALTTS
nr:nesprin-4 isoform X2 [Kogia breviceps]